MRHVCIGNGVLSLGRRRAPYLANGITSTGSVCFDGGKKSAYRVDAGGVGSGEDSYWSRSRMDWMRKAYDTEAEIQTPPARSQRPKLPGSSTASGIRGINDLQAKVRTTDQEHTSAHALATETNDVCVNALSFSSCLSRLLIDVARVLCSRLFRLFVQLSSSSTST